MYENTIRAVLSKDIFTRKCFLNVYARDELPSKVNYPSCFVLNTETRDKEGKHWIAIHYDENGTCYFFDSYGLPPSYYNMEQYIKKTSTKFTWNMKRLQGQLPYCGFYCIFFLLFKTRNNLNDFFKKFNTNLIENDIYIFKEINKNLKNKY